MQLLDNDQMIQFNPNSIIEEKNADDNDDASAKVHLHRRNSYHSDMNIFEGETQQEHPPFLVKRDMTSICPSLSVCQS